MAETVQLMVLQVQSKSGMRIMFPCFMEVTIEEVWIHGTIVFRHLQPCGQQSQTIICTSQIEVNLYYTQTCCLQYLCINKCKINITDPVGVKPLQSPRNNWKPCRCHQSVVPVNGWVPRQLRPETFVKPIHSNYPIKTPRVDDKLEYPFSSSQSDEYS